MGSISLISRFIYNLQLCQKQNFRCLKEVVQFIHFHQILHQEHYHKNTIFALSSSHGVSAVAVIRISGPNASEVLHKMLNLHKFPEPRKAVLCRIKDPETDELLDKALALWFPSPKSYTGEDICELHVHGGVAVTKSVLNALQKIPHFRLAEPGEFTKRAFLARKLDLTEVEGLADLLHAETEAQQRQALRQMEGGLYKLYSNWTNRIKKCLAKVEAYIDFSEDQHLDNTILDEVKIELGQIKEEIASHLSDKRRGEKLRNGVFTVLIGRPNVGKSSLLNNLCQRDVAIVSSTAGTTRDIIETSLNLGGYLVNISDTAGIRKTQDFIEQEGVRRAREKSSKADIIILVVEAKRMLEFYDFFRTKPETLCKCVFETELGKEVSNDLLGDNCYVSHENSNDHVQILILVNKIDLLTVEESRRIMEVQNLHPEICLVSCTEGTGMSNFVGSLSEKVKEVCCGHRGEEPTITQDRHRFYVQKCLHNISEYEYYLHYDIAIAAEKLRCGMNELGKITGKIRVDDILDVVFKDFCIGK